MGNEWIKYLGFIPLAPLFVAGILSLGFFRRKGPASALGIASMALAFAGSLFFFARTLAFPEPVHFEFAWMHFGQSTLWMGWLLDPLCASMLVMVSGVGLVIFVYSAAYMAADPNIARFYCFLSFFAGAMLGLVLSNNLLFLFICWELVGLASYLLIGFWYQKPAAAAAASKAFITTRIGDLGLLLGLVWLYSEAGTLVFYSEGQGVLEQAVLSQLGSQFIVGSVALTTAISLLLFWGAMGKSGQVPLHVWLPDAMEGPTPVSALIHAATMVAAGVFLMARLYPLLDVDPLGIPGYSPALTAITWVGAVTALLAALAALGQFDLKRILAYSTISQLGYMMMGLGTGGAAVALFHLLTHAAFKALLFLGAGSAIHGAGSEQDIRFLGGLKDSMRITFLTYAIGMLALAGFPLFFAGFWSKEGILHAAQNWQISSVPFAIGLIGAFLTAFYMTRQMYYVFFGESRLAASPASQMKPLEETQTRPGQPLENLRETSPLHSLALNQVEGEKHSAHESPALMTGPLCVLAFFSVVLGFLGTPFYPWLQSYLTGQSVSFHGDLFIGFVEMLVVSTALVGGGLWCGWFLYGRAPLQKPSEPDALEHLYPKLFQSFRHGFYFDELYRATLVRWHRELAGICDQLDRHLWQGCVRVAAILVLVCSWASRLADEWIFNRGFDQGCAAARAAARRLAQVQSGRIQDYLRWLAAAMGLLLLAILWSL